MKKFYFIGLLLMFPTGTSAPQEPQIRTGTRVGAMIIRLAVPEFQPRGVDERQRALTSIFNQVLWDDLEYSGVVTLISRSFYPLGTFGYPEDIKPEAWVRADLDTQFIAFGNTLVTSGRFVVEARLWDLKTRPEDREAIGQRFTGEENEESARLIAHQFADSIVHLLLGGVRGIAQTKIAFVSDRTGGNAKEIFVMDYDGHNQYPVTTYRSLSLTPSWAPDGEKVAFTTYRRNNADIGIVSRIDRRSFSFAQFLGTATTPVWSPDGNRIAFASSMNKVDDRNDMEIYIIDWNGRNPRRLTFSKGVDISPTWNPRTGREIAFVSDRGGSPQIYIVDVEGANVRRIIFDGGHAVNPAWSPDGQAIAFAWRKPGLNNFDIYLYDLTAERAVQLTQNSGNNERPTWAPDGRHLAFESSRTGTRQIYSMLADGTKTKPLTHVGNNQGPAWSGYIGQ